MTYIEEFNKLHPTIKGTVIIILFLMPFFCVSIYLLFPFLFTNSVLFYIPICFCFCFSVTWYLMNVGLSVFIVKFIYKIKKEKIEIEEMFLITGIMSIAYLSIIIVICYLCSLRLLYFLIIAYSYILFRIIWVLTMTPIFSWIIAKNNKVELSIDPPSSSEENQTP